MKIFSKENATCTVSLLPFFLGVDFNLTLPVWNIWRVGGSSQWNLLECFSSGRNTEKDIKVEMG